MSTAPAAAPKGYIHLNKVETQIVSEAGMEKFNELMELADKCNPDVQDCYVYNDFFGYAIVNITEQTLQDLVDVVKDKKRGATHKDALVLLEALTLFMALEDQFVMIDDGECFKKLVRVYGAALHTVASALSKAGLLTVEANPNASNLFLTAVSVLDSLHSISGVFTKADTSLIVLLCRAGLPYQKKKRTIEHPPKPVRSAASDDSGDDEDEDEEEEEEDEDPEPPKKRGRISKKETDPVKLAAMTYEEAEKQLCTNKELCSYNFTRVWANYQREYCREEMRFGQGFDITAWPESLRKQVSFDSLDV